MIERKHIEAIEKARVILHDEADKQGSVERAADRLAAAISAALAAADEPEAGCEWARVGGGPWCAGCLGEQPHVMWSTWSREQMTRCPHCGRKIVDANAASEGGEMEAGE